MILRALLRFVRKTRYSAAMAALGVALASASIVAVHLVTEEIAGQIEALIPDPLSAFSHTAVPDERSLDAAQFFELRRAWRAGQLEDVQSLAPVVDEQIWFADRQVRVVGIDLLAGDQLAEISDGSLERTSDEVLSGVWLTRDLAASEAVTEMLESRAVLGEIPGSGVLVADIGVAQALLGWAESDRLSYVALAVPSVAAQFKTWAERLSPGASAAWPDPSLEGLPGWTLRPALDQHPAARFGRSVLFNVSALGTLALVVAWFLIYQVAVFWLRRLSGMFVRLNVLGVGMERLAVYFVGLLVVLGITAALLGAWGGVVLARTLMGVIAGASLEGGLSALLLGKALGSATAVCVAGGGWAFFTEFGEATSSRRRLGVRGAVIGVALTLIVLGILVESTHLAGAFMSIALVSVLLAILMPLVMTLIRRRSRHAVGPMMLRMSLRESVWFPRDLSIAVSGLCLAIATAIGIGLMVDAFRADFSRMLEQRLSYDFDVSGSPEALAAAQRTLSRHPEVTRLQSYLHSQTRIGGVTASQIETRVDRYEARRYGLEAALGAEEALISEQLARALDLAPGDSVAMSDGTRLVVAGVFQGFGEAQPRVIRTPTDSGVGVLQEIRFNLSSEAPDAQLNEALTDLEWRDQGEIRRIALETFDRTFLITSALVSIAIFVAGIGVYVAVTVLRLNQRVSDRVLEGLGVSEGERRLVDLARGAGFGALACGLAVPLGMLIGWILCAVVNPRAFGWEIEFTVSFWPIAYPLMWGLLASIVACLVRLGRGEAAEGIPIE